MSSLGARRKAYEAVTFSIAISLAALFWLFWMLRADRVSLGLPIAYLSSLLLIHVPGAFAHVANPQLSFGSDSTEIGMRFAAAGAICFVAGVRIGRASDPKPPVQYEGDRRRFWLFCLMGGWLFTYSLSPLFQFPSFGAVVEQGGAIWMLGVLLGLRTAVKRRDLVGMGTWFGALLVYPVLMLLLGGFLSYGSAAIIIVCSALPIALRSRWQAMAGIVLAGFLGLSIFVNYFQARGEIRDAVWGGAPIEERIDAATRMFTSFEWFNPENQSHLRSLDERLNQNYFVGLAAERIESGQVNYLYGRSIWEGLLSLIPRVIWPEKPVFAGSPKIVSEMTGLLLSPTTSFGVGNVMEFQINFGFPGVIVGFLTLGWLLGILDRKAAVAEAEGDLGKAILFFLPAVALIQPNGSLVELTSASAAALIAAYGWKWLWTNYVSKEKSQLEPNARWHSGTR